MWMLIARGVIAGAVIVGVTVLANRSPRAGAFLLTLPLVSVLACVVLLAVHFDHDPFVLG